MLGEVIEVCMCGCMRSAATLDEVVLYEDPCNGTDDWREQRARYCPQSLQKAGGILCHLHLSKKRLFRVHELGHPKEQLVSVCFECLVEMVRKLQAGKSAELIRRLDQKWRRYFEHFGKAQDSGWYDMLGRDARVLAGMMLYYAPHIEPGDTPEGVLEVHVSQSELAH